MDDQIKERIRARCEESLRQNETLMRLLPAVGPGTLRSDFARRAIDLALEHHSAIVGLVLHGHYGSAGALLRPLLESGACAYWVMYSADNAWIRDLSKAARGESTRDIPELVDMLKSMKDEFFPVDEMRKGFQNKGPSTWLHKFTHGGVLQLSRRGNIDGWTEDDVRMHLICADIFSAVAAAVGTVISDAPDLALYVFPRRDALGCEIVDFLGIPPFSPQPHHLPKPISDGCEPFTGC